VKAISTTKGLQLLDQVRCSTINRRITSEMKRQVTTVGRWVYTDHEGAVGFSK
jgi:hypothetical protein